MNNFTITIKKRSDKFLDYQVKQARLISYLENIPVENLLELVEEYSPVPFTYQFKTNK